MVRSKKTKKKPKKGKKLSKKQLASYQASQRKRLVAHRQKSQPVIRGNKYVVDPQTGIAAKYTPQDIQQIRMASKGTALPQSFIYLLQPNQVEWTNDLNIAGVQLNWETIAESIIAACISKHPGEVVPLGPAALKFYLFWCWINRLRLQEDQALYSPAGNTAQFADTAWPQFNDKTWNVPTMWAKFIEYQMSYQDPNTGTKYQYRVNWDILTGGIPPVITSPSISTSPAGMFNQSILGNSFLTQIAPTQAPGLTLQEQVFGINPNGVAGITNQTVFNLGAKISSYFEMTTTTTAMKKVPMKAPDGSLYSYVFSSASLFPGIVSNIPYVNSEASYILHATQTPVTGQQTRETFRYVDPIPSILIDDAPTNVPLSVPAQVVFIVNAAFILSEAKYEPGGFKKCLKNVNSVYPSLRSFVPNYYTLNLNQWHELVEQHIQVITNNTTMNNTQNMLTQNHWYSLITVWESALLARVLQFAYPSIIFYTASDVASCTACSSQFASAQLPPLLADYIAGIGPVVTGGKLYTPLLDYRPPTAAYGPTAKFTNLAVGWDPTASRWLSIADAPVTLLPASNPPVPYMFVPTTITPITATQPPTSLDRSQPFAYGLYAPTLVAGGFTQNGLIITRNNMLGGLVSDAVPGLLSAYAPATPWKYASQFMTQYKIAIQNSETYFMVLEQVALGIFAQMSPVVIQLVCNNSYTQISNLAAGAAALFLMLDCYPMNTGSLQPLDSESLGRIATYAYRVAGSVDNMPFMTTLASTTNVAQSLAANTVKAQGTSEWLLSLQNKMSKLNSNIQALRSCLAPLFETVCPNKGSPHSVGNAVAIVLKSTKDIVSAPYHSQETRALGTFNSENALEQGAKLATSGNPLVHLGLGALSIFDDIGKLFNPF